MGFTNIFALVAMAVWDALAQGPLAVAGTIRPDVPNRGDLRVAEP